MKILFVCVGNVCRSPLAEGLLRKKLNEHNIDVEVGSAGLEPYHIGHKPDKGTFRIAEKYNVDISDHIMRLFGPKDFDVYDKIYVMDQLDMRGVLHMARNEEDKKKVQKIMQIVDPEKTTTIPNPFHKRMEDFEKVFEMLDKATDKIIESLK